jgi:hypothetical protein
MKEAQMNRTELLLACALAIAIGPVPQITAQVQTQVPEPTPGAMPVKTEHIRIHGTALEGNLEGDTADRDVIVFAPPGYDKDKKRH